MRSLLSLTHWMHVPARMFPTGDSGIFFCVRGLYPSRPGSFFLEFVLTKRFLVVVAVLALAGAQQPAALRAQRVATPADIKLVLLIAVDQFRADYLARFDSEYKEGFRRLLTDGAVFTNAKLEHYPTVTAIGHSTMLSGAIPADSGIIGNDWYDRQSATTVTSVSDTSAQVVGGSATAGTAASPRRLLVSTVADELKMARTRPGAESPRVVGISLKDRAAILPAGRGADAAYWLDMTSGAFISSTYYQP